MGTIEEMDRKRQKATINVFKMYLLEEKSINNSSENNWN